MVILTQIMDARFCVNILRVGLLPFIESQYPDHHRFQQDNDPKYTSHKAKELFDDNGINWWHTPAESPYLNPIEKVWSHMKYYLAYTIICCRYIDHIYKVIPKVIEKEWRACH